MHAAMWKNALGWGLALWAIGYVLGIALFTVVPATSIGWLILPVGLAITIWVLLKRVTAERPQGDVAVAVTWTLIAVLADYLFIVKLLAPPDGYYKLDVYLYYALTFGLPFIVGDLRRRAGHVESGPRRVGEISR